MQQVLDQSGANPARLKIELTESLVLENVSDAIAKMHALKAIGIGLSMDDFGTGFSSLSYLKQLPIDNLKIDRSFVQDIPGDANGCAIAAAVIGLARTLGLDAIAEGIETREQQDYLARIGCDKMQGYLHARPLTADAFATFATRPLTSWP